MAEDGTVVIVDTPVRPGQRARIDIPVARLPTGTWMYMPAIVVNGTAPGPSMWLSAALHGDELNGTDIIRRVLTTLTPSSVAGTIYAVPVVNAFGFVNRERYLPDRRDLNRSFPGSRSGSLAARIAHLFMEQIVARCAIGIDLHTGSGGRSNLPQARVNDEDAEAVRLARVMAPPVIIRGSTRPGTLRSAATKRGAHVVVFEGGEAGRFDAFAIEAGVASVQRALHDLGMIPSAPPATEPVFESAHTEWVRARRSGLVQFWVPLGAHVSRRQPVGIIADTAGEVASTVSAPADGVIVALATDPRVHQGDALVHIAKAL